VCCDYPHTSFGPPLAWEVRGFPCVPLACLNARFWDSHIPITCAVLQKCLFILQLPQALESWCTSSVQESVDCTGRILWLLGWKQWLGALVWWCSTLTNSLESRSFSTFFCGTQSCKFTANVTVGLICSSCYIQQN